MKTLRIVADIETADVQKAVRRFYVRYPFGKLINILQHE